jgi:hypothetical protein
MKYVMCKLIDIAVRLIDIQHSHACRNYMEICYINA